MSSFPRFIPGLYQGLCQNVEQGILDSMVRNYESCLSFLRSTQAPERAAALVVLRHHWRRKDLLPLVSKQMAYEDPDKEVRCIAVSILGGCYINTGNHAIGKLLAASVLAEAEDLGFRRFAYCALLVVYGRSDLFGPVMVKNEFDLKGSVDWGFINDLLSENPPGPYDPIKEFVSEEILHRFESEKGKQGPVE